MDNFRFIKYYNDKNANGGAGSGSGNNNSNSKKCVSLIEAPTAIIVYVSVISSISYILTLFITQSPQLLTISLDSINTEQVVIFGGSQYPI